MKIIDLTLELYDGLVPTNDYLEVCIKKQHSIEQKKEKDTSHNKGSKSHN